MDVVVDFHNPPSTACVSRTQDKNKWKSHRKDDMKKLTYKEAFEIASESFKLLTIYFNVTRPMNNKVYFKDGKFSVEEYSRQMKFLSAWNGMSRIQKKAHAKKYADYSKAYNLTQGVPNGLLKKLCCLWYYGEDGKRRQINYSDIVKNAISSGEIIQTNQGSKFKKKKDGGWEKKCWWSQKFLFADPKRQYGMMTHSWYSDLKTYPNYDDELSLKNVAYIMTKDAIFKFYKKNVSDKAETTETVEEKTVSETSESVERKVGGAKEKIIALVDGVVKEFNQTNIRRRELEELRKMPEGDVVRLFNLLMKHYKDTRSQNLPKWQMDRPIDSAIRISMPDVSDDLRTLFSQFLPKVFDIKGVLKK